MNAREMEAGRDIVSWEKISSFGWHFGSRRLLLELDAVGKSRHNLFLRLTLFLKF